MLKAIDEMMETMNVEAKSDKDKKDHCTAEYQSIGKKVNNFAFLIQTNAAKIEEIEAKIHKLNDARAKAQKEIEEINAELDEMSATRLEQHALFKSDQADDELAIKVLAETAAALSKYYEENKAAAAMLIQYDPKDLSKARKELKNKENKYTLTHSESQKGAADTILALIDKITVNLKDEIAEGIEDEGTAQVDFEKQTEGLRNSKDKLDKEVVSIEGMIAEHSEKKSAESSTKDNNQVALDGENTYKAGIKEECDWILAKFAERAQKRNTEVGGLVRAKELLSGGSFVQKGSSQDSNGSDSSNSHDHGSFMHYFGLLN